MHVFNIVRGSYRRYGGPSTNFVNPSVIRITGISSIGANVFVSSFSVNDVEKLGIIQCFEDTNHIYAFGHDPESSRFSVSYLAFMGERCMRNIFRSGAGVGKLVKDYNKEKVSKRKNGKGIVKMTFGNGTALDGVIANMNVSVADPEINLVSITIGGNILRWR